MAMERPRSIILRQNFGLMTLSWIWVIKSEKSQMRWICILPGETTHLEWIESIMNWKTAIFYLPWLVTAISIILTLVTNLKPCLIIRLFILLPWPKFVLSWVNFYHGISWHLHTQNVEIHKLKYLGKTLKSKHGMISLFFRNYHVQGLAKLLGWTSSQFKSCQPKSLARRVLLKSNVGALQLWWAVGEQCLAVKVHLASKTKL